LRFLDYNLKISFPLYKFLAFINLYVKQHIDGHLQAFVSHAGKGKALSNMATLYGCGQCRLFLLRIFGDWQGEKEFGPLAGFALHPYSTVVHLHKVFAENQPKSRPLFTTLPCGSNAMFTCKKFFLDQWINTSS